MASFSWKEIHDKLKVKLQLEERAKKDNVDAIKIESLLRDLKSIKSQTSTNIVTNELTNQFNDLLESSFLLLNKERGGGLKSHTLFKRAHKTVKTFAGDDIFEEELAAVIATIENKATGGSSSVTSHLINAEQLNIKYKDLAEEVLQGFSEAAFQRIQNDLNLHTEDFKATVSKSGKADVQGITLNATGIINPKWEELFRLFQNKTFSVKNYSSMAKTLDISLGETLLSKSIPGSLYAIGYDKVETKKIFSMGLNSNRQRETALTHFYHLQFGYELMGLGLGTINKNNEFEDAKQVDFFIYNDPNSDNVFVKSTAQMFLDIINSKERKVKITKSIKISKADFD